MTFVADTTSVTISNTTGPCFVDPQKCSHPTIEVTLGFPFFFIYVLWSIGNDHSNAYQVTIKVDHTSEVPLTASVTVNTSLQSITVH